MKLSQRQHQEHYQLYQSYIEKTMAAVENPQSNRTWKKDFNYNYSGMKLHQWYFEHLAATPGSISNDLLSEVHRNFGSLEKWKNDFVAQSLVTRPAGWSFLCYDRDTKRLFNIASDEHDQMIPGLIPLIVLDMYEHAFYIDFGNDKEKYVKTFLKDLSWDLVERRWIKAAGFLR